MPHSIKLMAPAKLNIFLHINGRLDDGYHHIQTLFQPIDWYDQLQFSLAADHEIQISMEYQLNHFASVRHAVPNSPELNLQDNLIYKAAKLLQEYSSIAAHEGTPIAQNKKKTSVQGAKIRVIKTIPLGAGLGGGSTDAAASLLALNKLWQLDLSSSVLLDLAKTLGADVPALVHSLLYRQSVLGEGRGEKLCPVKLARLWFLIFIPNCHCDTQIIFAQQELTRNTKIITIADLKIQIESKGLSALTETELVRAMSFTNDCMSVVRKLYPPIDELVSRVEKLAEDAFSKPRLTGTGAAVFMMFTSLHQAEKMRQKFLAEVPEHGLAGIRVASSIGV